MQVLLTKKELECKSLLIIILLIAFVIFILKKLELIVGGVIFEMQEQKIFDGELIIF